MHRNLFQPVLKAYCERHDKYCLYWLRYVNMICFNIIDVMYTYGFHCDLQVIQICILYSCKCWFWCEWNATSAIAHVAWLLSTKLKKIFMLIFNARKCFIVLKIYDDKNETKSIWHPWGESRHFNWLRVIDLPPAVTAAAVVAIVCGLLWIIVDLFS